MQDSEYWKLRFEQLEAAQNGQGAATVAEIERQYKEAQKQIEGQIARWYQRFADNNGISLAEARQYLKGAALKEFKWDVQDYIKYGQDNALMGGWMKELENASAKYHISKLEALKIQTQQSLEVMFSKQLGTVTGAMGDLFESGYYHTAYELQKGFHIGWDIAGLDQSQIEKVLAKPWAVDGKNFSERIWGNKKKLISEVHGELTQNIMLGADPQKAIDSLAKKMKTSRYNAGRLIMTEEAYFSSVAQKDCFEELGVEQFEIVATLDSHTSDLCRSLDGKHFPMKDYQPGVTAPPFHVFCRSTTAPYFDEDFEDIGERAAKNEETGKTYYIPDDMNYQEWKRTFIDGGSKDGLKKYEAVDNSRECDIIKALDIDDFELMSDIKDIDPKVVDTIYSVIKKYEDAGDIYINDFYIGSLPIGENGTPLLQIEPIADQVLRLNVNADIFGGKTVEEIDNLLKASSKNLAVSLEEAVIHECGHAKSLRGLKIVEIKKMYEEIANIKIKGISEIAYQDGAEALAEIEILLSRGSTIPKDIMDFYNKYMRRR